MPNHSEIEAFGQLLKKRNIVLVFLEGISFTGKTFYTTLTNPPGVKITLDFTNMMKQFPEDKQELIKSGQANTTIGKLYYNFLCQHFWDVLKKNVDAVEDGATIAIDRAPISNFVYQLVHLHKDLWEYCSLKTIAYNDFLAAKPIFNLAFDYKLAQKFPENFKIFVFKRENYEDHVKFMETHGPRTDEFYKQDLLYIKGQNSVFTGMCEAFNDVPGIRLFELGEKSVTEALKSIL